MRTTDTNGSWIDTASESTGRQGRSGTNAARVIVVFVTCLLSTPSCKGSKDSAETTAPSTAAGSASTRVSAQPAGSTPSERLLTKPRYETSACAAPPDCEKECGAGRAHACKRLADMMKLGVVEDSKERRAVLQEKACNGGVLAACSALARQYNNGEGVTLDVKKAHQLWKDACDNGWGNACGSLGLQTRLRGGNPAGLQDSRGTVQEGLRAKRQEFVRESLGSKTRRLSNSHNVCGYCGGRGGVDRQVRPAAKRRNRPPEPI